MSPTRRKFLVVLGAVLFVLLNVYGIARRFRKRVHFAVASVPELPYPSCDQRTDSLASEHSYRALPTSAERGTEERFSVRDYCGGSVLSVRRVNGREIVDAEVVLDREGAPLRAWRRIATQGPRGMLYDTRLYEIRTPLVTVTHRATDGALTFEEYRARSKPTMVLLPGIGSLSHWIKSAALSEGGRDQRMVLDLRQPLERQWLSTLRRERDMDEASLGRRVRVYSLDEGSVFVDDNGAVLGDLAGNRQVDRVGVAALPVTEPEPTRRP